MSEVDKTVAATVGYRLRGGALVEQAGQTKTLALAEMDRFKQEQLLGDAHIAELDDAVAKVLAGLHDRTLATGEAHLQTAGQATAMHELKDDRRRLIRMRRPRLPPPPRAARLPARDLPRPHRRRLLHRHEPQARLRQEVRSRPRPRRRRQGPHRQARNQAARLRSRHRRPRSRHRQPARQQPRLLRSQRPPLLPHQRHHQRRPRPPRRRARSGREVQPEGALPQGQQEGEGGGGAAPTAAS